MKKIGLITFHAAHNIGSMLQTYAIQSVLTEKYNMNCEIINFSNVKQQEMYSIYDKTRGIKGIIKNCIIFILQSPFKKRYNDFEKFKNAYFNLSEEFYETDVEMSGIEERYDILICGSDQIWNTNCEDFDDVYFLSFAKKIRKVAYAPSLGGRNILKIKGGIDKYKKYLEDFSNISVRELNGKLWLEQIINKDVELVPDPTILVDKDIWSEIEAEREFAGDYLFFYGSVYDKRIFSTLHYISKQTKLKIVMLNLNAWLFKGNFYKGVKLSKHTSPSDYLSLIKNAKLVITTSYHGTIFSTLYRKNFWTLTFKESNPDDDRMKTLLQQLALENRMVCLEDISKYDLLEKVDYSRYEESIKSLKKKGYEYLDKIFYE